MVRYYWNPDTGNLEFKDTVKQIKRAFGDIPFFVSPDFARAYKLDETLDLPKERFEGSNPPIGWTKKAVAGIVEPIKELWEELTEFTQVEKLTTYIKRAKAILDEAEKKVDKIAIPTPVLPIKELIAERQRLKDTFAPRSEIQEIKEQILILETTPKSRGTKERQVRHQRERRNRN